MNPYAMERINRQRTEEFRAEAARRRPAGNRGRAIKHRTGWALIQIGLALVTSSARGQHRPVSPELP
jgi:hypothetical protein